jgi:MFS family permease
MRTVPERGSIALIVAAAAMVGTLPGRTQGLGLVTEPVLADLGISRIDYAQLNLWATLIGSAGAIGVGRFIDRFGSGVVISATAFALGVTVSLMSGVHSMAMLTIAMTATRTLGQSALSVASLAMVGQSFRRHVDGAMALYSILMSVGFMIAFPLVGFIVQSRGWRAAWLTIGVALVVGLAPAALLVKRPNPEPGFENEDASPSTENIELHAYTLRAAVATPAFWVFALGAALYGLVASGIGLFNESILAERGLGPGVYYQTLMVTAMTALVGNFAGGWLAGSIALNRLMGLSLSVLALGLAFLPQVMTRASALAWATMMGLGGGLVMVLFFSVWPRVYGRQHLGRIQGAAQAMTVIASAVGPLLLAATVGMTGSYAAMFYILAAAIAGFALAAFAVPLPDDRTVETLT